MPKIHSPRIGWRLAWRQTYPTYSDLYHRHGSTIFPERDKERLEAHCASVNAAYGTQNGGHGAIFQWIEEYDETSDEICTGNHWGIKTERRKRHA